MFQISQAGMNTSDIPGSLRLFSEVLGYKNAGGQALWGPPILVQGLGTDARATLWWLVGSQPYFQLEFFNHTRPMQRPLPEDWHPTDLGWGRLGFTVADFDASLEALKRNEIGLLGPIINDEGFRRAAFREPYIGNIIEIVEDDPRIIDRSYPAPAMISAMSSVSDLDGARVFYGDLLGLRLEPLERTRKAEHEAMWGLRGAAREGFAVRVKDVVLEIICYNSPGRPKPQDYRTSDQGIVNIGLGARSTDGVKATFDRLTQAGYTNPYFMQGDGFCGGYIIDPEREVEMFAIPPSMDAFVGFTPAAPFITELK